MVKTMLCAAFALFLAAAPASAAVEHDPVLFVHGSFGSSGDWNDMIADFRRDGYPAERLHAWTYDTLQSNRTTADQLAGAVDDLRARTGASKVDIVTHSLGGIGSRWYLKFLSGSGKVDDWVSLAGPNHGTGSVQACRGRQVVCQEVTPGSELLNTLNGGDETPGATSYGTWWSQCDQVIVPPNSTSLQGARNTRTTCIAHHAFLTDDTVSRQVRDFVS